MDRRDFLRTSSYAAGAWLLSGVLLPVRARSGGAVFRPSPLIRLTDDGDITLFVIKQEMGQGVRTALPLVLAEELDADFERVAVEPLPYDPDQAAQYNTWASASVRSTWTNLRKAGASARAMLVAAAAQRWQVAPERCRTERGFVIRADNGARLSYGELARAASAMPVPAQPRLKEPRQFRLIGKPPRRIQVREKVNGQLGYGIDVAVPGMVYATIVRSPTVNGKLKRFDDKAVRALGPGILAVLEVASMPGCGNRNGVAIVATGTWLALRAQDLIEVEWEAGQVPHADSAALSAALRQAAVADAPALTFDRSGKSKGFAALAGADVQSAEYALPFLTQAPMEPMNCTAWYHDGKYEIWGGFQAPAFFASALPAAFGVPKSAIVPHLLPMGGAFGRKEKVDNAAEAMQLSRALGKPVKLLFSRPDDTRNSFYRPASHHRLSAVTDGQRIQAWRHQVAVATFPDLTIGSPQDIYGGPAADLCYPVLDYQSAFYPVASPLPIGSWRSISYSHNVFAVESFIDELAAHGNADPLAFRLALLRQPGGKAEQGEHRRRLAAVLERCAAASGWQQPAPPGRHRGIACCVYAHTHAYVAHVVELSVSADQAVRIHRVVCAIDCGLVVDPSGFRAQVEGSLAWALSAALKDEITVRDGAVQQQTFSDYEVLRMHEFPPFDVVVIDSAEAPGGAGEPAVPSLAPALCNAMFAATGQRVRALPLQKAGYRFS